MLSTTGRKTPTATGTELGELTAEVSRWGTEAGCLGIEGHLEGRVQALVREAALRLFGNRCAERDALVSRIESMERQREDSVRKVEEVRSARVAIRSRHGLAGWILSWFVRGSELVRAQAVVRRNDPELRKAQLDLDIAERGRRDAAEWREMAVQHLRATYEYRKARAAAVRPENICFEKEREQTHDTQDHRRFIVYRGN